MKVIDILNEMVAGTIKEGFKFEYKGDIFEYYAGRFYNYRWGNSFGVLYYLDEILTDEVKVLEKVVKKREK